jgi:NDP-sugar pyrophosphorylase family protein
MAIPSPLPPLFAELPPAIRDLYRPEKPWELLGAALDDLLDRLPSHRLSSPIPPEAHVSGDRIVIAPGVRIHPGVTLEGPLYIGPDSELRPGAYLRGGVWIEERCLVGANTEIKRGILLPGSKAPHLNYVGDSVVGAGVNLGAGTVLSNFRHDGGEIRIPWGEGRLATGRRKLGAILGDGVHTGCNCVLHPGVVVGRQTQLYPGVQLRSGVYAERSIVKLRQQLEIRERR